MSGTSGQALVESVIVLPLMLFVFLSLFQLMLIAHGRVMLEYAAFNATRAGVVHNGDRATMRNAALISLLPLYGPTNDMAHLAETYARAKAWALVSEAGEAIEGGVRGWIRDVTGFSLPNLPPIGIVDVWPVNPTFADFGASEEIDLDLPAQYGDVGLPAALQRTRLTTSTTWLFELRVPVANRLVFYSWFLWHYLRTKVSGSWLDPRAGTTGSRTVENAMNDASFATVPGSGFAGILEQQVYFQYLRLLAGMDNPKFVMPLSATYSMPMESNLFRDNFR